MPIMVFTNIHIPVREVSIDGAGVSYIRDGLPTVHGEYVVMNGHIRSAIQVDLTPDETKQIDAVLKGVAKRVHIELINASDPVEIA